jgi:plasmid stabilization system protein ParE
MLAHEFHPLAARELEEAVEHYESLEAGKGLELARQVRAAIAQVCEFPESAPIARGTIRSIVVQPGSRWEYTVHYRAKPTIIRVLAVAHQARQPFYWFGRR